MTLTETAPDLAAPAGGGRDPDRKARGVLIIGEDAATNVVTGVLVRQCPDVSEPAVAVRLIGDDTADISVSMTMAYPTAPLGGVLAAIRRHVSTEAGRQLGRTIARVDLTVTHFSTTEPQRAPRVA